jgi:hypothetical protein
MKRTLFNNLLVRKDSADSLKTEFQARLTGALQKRRSAKGIDDFDVAGSTEATLARAVLMRLDHGGLAAVQQWAAAQQTLLPAKPPHK